MQKLNSQNTIMKPYLFILLILIFFTTGCNEEKIKADYLALIDTNMENEELLEVSVCDLKKSPEKYNHKLVEVTGFFSQGFEDFSVSDPECNSEQLIWLEYGGMAKSGTIHCCNETIANTRPKPLEIENITIPLVGDEKFKNFRELLSHSNGTGVSILATVEGRFFSGRKKQRPDKTYYGGFGHMGGYSLFAIQKVIRIDEFRGENLNYFLEPDFPEYEDADNHEFFRLSDIKERIELQRSADNGERKWSFENPQKVATETLSNNLKIDEKSIVRLRIINKMKDQVAYKWIQLSTGETFITVVSRPSWLSFYAKNKHKVAWIPVALYKIKSQK